MLTFRLLIATAALVCVSARHLVLEDETGFYFLPNPDLDLENQQADGVLLPGAMRAGRMRRQVQGSVAINSDGSSGANLKLPLGNINDKNALSAIGAVDLNNQFKVAQSTTGLALDNANGHGLTLTHSKLPGADRIAAAGKVNLFHNDNHNVDATAFAARTMPKADPSVNTYGGGAEYMYKNKVGAEVNMNRTPFYDQTNYSAMGKLNLFRGTDTSLDFNTGLSKSVSPHMSSSWQPFTGFTMRKWF